MLSKKQYLYTLLIAILAFLAVFAVTYFYMKENSWTIGQEEPNHQEVAKNPIASQRPQEIYVLPQTVIRLKNQDTKRGIVRETKLDSKSLLGLTKEEVAKQFSDYTIETFNEKEVTLVKNVKETKVEKNADTVYVLGVEDQYVCIKEKNTKKRPVKIDYEVSHFSKYMYSLLLNEEIEITSAQKEKLLLNPSSLQKILQGYVGE